jgi:hypothetical protein
MRPRRSSGWSSPRGPPAGAGGRRCSSAPLRAWSILLYLVFFGSMSLRAVADATLLAPARLMTLGKRTLLPDFMARGVGIEPARRSRRSRRRPSRGRGPCRPAALRAWLAAAVLLGAVLPVGLARRSRVADPPAHGRLARGERGRRLAQPARRSDKSTRTWLAAAFRPFRVGLRHYFWSRADPPHLYPLLALRAAAALFAWQDFRFVERVAVAALFVLAFVPFKPWRVAEPPVVGLWNGGLARVRELAARPGATLLTIWPAGEVPSPAALAVSLADRLSSPGSRFVAYGTDQRLCAGDPVYLFLLSRRAPYTRWFQYDPGVQSSAPVQEEMIRELAAAGSAAVVVWRSEAFQFDPSPAPPPRKIAVRRGGGPDVRTGPGAIRQFRGAHPRVRRAARARALTRRQLFQHARDRLGVRRVLLLEDPRRQRLDGVAGQHRYFPLQDDRAVSVPSST